MGGTQSADDLERKALTKERSETIRTRCIRTEVDEETGETLFVYNALSLDSAVTHKVRAIAQIPRSTAMMGMKWVADDSDYIETFEMEYQSWLKEPDSAVSDKMRFDESTLRWIFSRLIDNNMYSLLEFYCVQELSLTDFWDRPDFKKAALVQMAYCIGVGKLHPLKIFASYLIPSKCVSEAELTGLLKNSNGRMAAGSHGSGAQLKACRQMAREVVDAGIKDFALNIVETRECLLEMELIPTDLVPTLLSFLFFGSVKALRRIKAP